MSMMQRELYEFGPFTLDAVERTVSREGTPLAMTPKVFETLLYLVRNQGRILSKDELLEKIWPGVFVEEVNLAVNISTLRKLLGDSAQDPRYVTTVSGRGYRFIAEVRVDPETGKEAVGSQGEMGRERPSGAEAQDSPGGSMRGLPPPPPSESAPYEPTYAERVPSGPASSEASKSSGPGSSEGAEAASEIPVRRSGGDTASVAAPVSHLLMFKGWRVALLVAVLMLVTTGIFFWRKGGRPKPVAEADTSIAVLAFTDLSRNKDQEYFSDGLTDELTDDLTKIPGVKVIARSSAFQFKGKNEDLRVVGQKLGVANILEGSVRRDGDRIRITAGLTKVKDGFQFWSETYDRNASDVFEVQQDIAHAVASALQVRLVNPSHFFDSPHSRNPAAYEPYLKAQYYYTRGEDKDDLDKALIEVDRAIQLDDSFAAVWALRASVINTAATLGLRDHEEGYREALAAAEKAIALDKNLAAGYLAMASIKLNFEWDWEGAENALKMATSLQPGSAVVLSYRAYLYECTGRLDDAIALTEEASVLDPLRTNAYLGALLTTAGRYDEARAALEKVLAANPGIEGTHGRLAMIALAQGRAKDALAEAQRESGEWEKLTAEALVYHDLKRRDESDAALNALIAKHAQDAPYQVAEVYAYRGETEKAMEWLERAYKQRDPGLNQVKLDPLLRSLEGDERYGALLKRMGLAG
jgi:TolB-like protein/DNA-binding winged helix-turn-helix (wHTH) protein/Tfp pilus assembly protein PilF